MYKYSFYSTVYMIRRRRVLADTQWGATVRAFGTGYLQPDNLRNLPFNEVCHPSATNSNQSATFRSDKYPNIIETVA